VPAGQHPLEPAGAEVLEHVDGPLVGDALPSDRPAPDEAAVGTQGGGEGVGPLGVAVGQGPACEGSVAPEPGEAAMRPQIRRNVGATRPVQVGGGGHQDPPGGGESPHHLVHLRRRAVADGHVDVVGRDAEHGIAGEQGDPHLRVAGHEGGDPVRHVLLRQVDGGGDPQHPCESLPGLLERQLPTLPHRQHLLAGGEEALALGGEADAAGGALHQPHPCACLDATEGGAGSARPEPHPTTRRRQAPLLGQRHEEAQLVQRHRLLQQ